MTSTPPGEGEGQEDPRSGFRRRGVSRHRLHAAAADALRRAHRDGTATAVDCPQCGASVRIEATGPVELLRQEGSALHAALLDHLFRRCAAVEVIR